VDEQGHAHRPLWRRVSHADVAARLSADELDGRRRECLLAGELGRDRGQVALVLRGRQVVVFTAALAGFQLGRAR
jgi:hypothetical protein